MAMFEHDEKLTIQFQSALNEYEMIKEKANENDFPIRNTNVEDELNLISPLEETKS